MGRGGRAFLLTLMLVGAAVGCSRAILTGSGESGSSGPSAVNLQIPIEILSRPTGSATSAFVLNRSRTSLNTSDYDGAVSYFFEIVAYSADGSAQAVSLIDEAGVARATITVPAGAGTYTRYRSIFTPNAGSETYRLSFPATAASNNLTVYAARIIINQVGATKTRIYIPLTGNMIAANGTTDTGTTGLTDGTSSTSFAQGQSSVYHKWIKKPGAFSQLDPTRGWTFEAVLSASGGSTGFVGLGNTSISSMVSASIVSATGTTPALVTTDFGDQTPAFNDGDIYEVKIRNSTGSVQTTELYKAGLWARISPIKHGLVYYRVSNARGTYTNNEAFPYFRFLAEPYAFTNPYITLSFYSPNATASEAVYLEDTGGSSSAATGSAAAGTTLYGNGGTGIVESGGLSLNPVSNYHLHFTGTATCVFRQAFVEVGFGAPPPPP